MDICLEAVPLRHMKCITSPQSLHYAYFGIFYKPLQSF